ncbi:glycine-rich domain-containing protein [Shivajiella indica]|uniref:Glycine-rich domain-containing protein n=1 Tax=Shivajiella indica TaxID=872115 RepID=A0ABW5BCU3_9BACT
MKIEWISKFILWVLLIGFAVIFEVSGQCSNCTVTINGNDVPIGAMVNGSVVCISGNRTNPISFNNRNNISICIADGATWNGNAQQLSGLSGIENFGFLQVNSDFNGNWTINNYSQFTFSGNINSNKAINNFGEMTISGNTTISSNSTLNSNGILNITGAVNFNSNANVTLKGNTSIGGSVVVNANTSINFAGNLSVGGAMQLNSNSQISNLNSNHCNSITVNGAFSNNGQITGNNLGPAGSPLNVNKAPTGNALAGGAVIGSCPTRNCVQQEILQTSNGYDVVYIFSCSDTFVVPPVPSGEEILDISVAVVAGGGGGGLGEAAGGGGAGEIIRRDAIPLVVGGAYPVVVGAGGTGSSALNSRGNNGNVSAFFGVVSLGGGGGGSSSSGARNGAMGGSGGGAAANNGAGSGAGTRGGNNGSNTRQGGDGRRGGNGNQLNGGGGGGAGGAGGNGANNNPGSGGNGIALDILTNVPNIQNAFGGGGGSTGRNPANQYGRGTGGRFSGIDLGGDGEGTVENGLGGAGRANTGSGGGAGRNSGGAGSAGLVVLRISFGILPIDFLLFDADFIEKDRWVELSWQVADSEIDTQFDIERSVNNLDNWQKISTQGHLGYADKNLPLGGGMLYYRIKQFDQEGNFNYSRVISVRLPSIQISQGVWRAFPNPTNGDQFRLDLLDFERYAGEELEVKLVSPTSGIQILKGLDLDSISSFLQEKLKQSPKGVYVVEISWGNRVEHIKVLKQ